MRHHAHVRHDLAFELDNSAVAQLESWELRDAPPELAVIIGVVARVRLGKHVGQERELLFGSDVADFHEHSCARLVDPNPWAIELPPVIDMQMPSVPFYQRGITCARRHAIGGI